MPMPITLRGCRAPISCTASAIELRRMGHSLAVQRKSLFVEVNVVDVRRWTGEIGV